LKLVARTTLVILAKGNFALSKEKQNNQKEKGKKKRKEMDASRRKRKASRVQRLTPRQQEAQSWAVVAGAGDDAVDSAAAAFILAPQVVEAKDEEQEDELLPEQQQQPRKRQKVKKGKKRLGAGSRQKREHAAEEATLTIRTLVGQHDDEDGEEAEGGASRCIFIASGFALQDELASAEGEGGLSGIDAAASSLPATIARIRLVPFKSAILSDAEIDQALAADHTPPPPATSSSSSSSTSADSCQLRATLGLFLSTEGDVVACAPFDSAFASRIAATGDDGSVQVAPPVVPQEVIDAALYLLRHKPHLVGVQAALVAAGSSSRERRVELRFLVRSRAFKGNLTAHDTRTHTHTEREGNPQSHFGCRDTTC
jgi:hypothetical protein